MDRIGYKLQSARIDRGLSQQEVAKLTGKHVAQISHFETDRRFPTPQDILDIARVLEIDHKPLMQAWVKHNGLSQVLTVRKDYTNE